VCRICINDPNFHILANLPNRSEYKNYQLIKHSIQEDDIKLRAKLPFLIDFFDPAFRAIKEIGGTATVEEWNKVTFEIMQLTNEQLSIYHKRYVLQANYRMAWTRTYLKISGLIINTNRGIWTLTDLGKSTENLDPFEIFRTVKSNLYKKYKATQKING